MAIELRIFSKEDRVTVAGILFDNGYRIEQVKKPRAGVSGQPAKSYDYLIIAEDMKGLGKE